MTTLIGMCRVCSKPAHSNDLCVEHLRAAIIRYKQRNGLCMVETCKASVHAKSMCKPHYEESLRESDDPERQCEAEDCTKGMATQKDGMKLCSKHRMRFLRTGSVKLRSREKTCVVDECNKLVHAKEMCQKHYNRDYYLRQKAKKEGVVAAA